MVEGSVHVKEVRSTGRGALSCRMSFVAGEKMEASIPAESPAHCSSLLLLYGLLMHMYMVGGGENQDGS